MAKLVQEAGRRKHMDPLQPAVGPSNNSTAPMPPAVGSQQLLATAKGPPIPKAFFTRPSSFNPSDSSSQARPAAQTAARPLTTAAPIASSSGPSVPSPPSSSSQPNPANPTTWGPAPTTGQSLQPPTNYFGQLRDVRRQHRSTNIKTRLILDEVSWFETT